jgi:integrase
MSNFKVIVKPVRGQLDNVYLYLYKLRSGNRIPELTSLKIKLPKIYCIQKDGNFKKVSKEIPIQLLERLGFNDVTTLNSFINEKLSDFIRINGDKKFIPNDSKTLNDWFDIIIERTLNQGTKLRYLNVKNITELFHLWYSENILKVDKTKTIPFSIIDIDYINRFKNWLRENQNNTINTSNYKLKCLKSILNKSINEGYYTYVRNPFSTISFSQTEKKVDILDIKELNILINTNFIEVYRRTIPNKEGVILRGKTIIGGVEERNKRNTRYISKHSLNDIRNYFLFQLFCQGIRVSDLITLRWRNFVQEKGKLKIRKVMVKTNESISIMVNDKMTAIISNYISRYEILDKGYKLIDEQYLGLKKLLKDDFYFLIGPEHKYYTLFSKINDLNTDNLVIKKHTIYFKINKLFIKRFLSQNISNKHPQSKLNLEIQDWYQKEKNNHLTKIKKQFDKVKIQKHNEVCKKIIELSNSLQKDDFVFNLLNPKDFENIKNDDYSRMSENQYRKFQSIRSYYNKNLKLIGEQAGIKKNLTSHLSRHSYTSLMVELGENINLFDVMSSLGHKHIRTTQTYLTRLDNSKIDKLNQIISDKLDEGDFLNI